MQRIERLLPHLLFKYTVKRYGDGAYVYPVYYLTAEDAADDIRRKGGFYIDYVNGLFILNNHQGERLEVNASDEILASFARRVAWEIQRGDG